jgi:hypothetical protein
LIPSRIERYKGHRHQYNSSGEDTWNQDPKGEASSAAGEGKEGETTDLVLLLPRITLLLYSLDLTLEVLGLDVDLAKPKMRRRMGSRRRTR